MSDGQRSSSESDIVQVRNDVSEIRNNVQSLTRLIRDGNGRPPLMERVALLERSVVDMTTALREIRSSVDAQGSEAVKGKWSLITTIITAVLALLTAVLSGSVLLNK